MTPGCVVWGAGAIGGTVGAFLARAGHNVVFVDQATAHVTAIREQGLRITGPLAQFVVQAPAFTPDGFAGTAPLFLLCVKAQHTEQATTQLLPHLAADGVIVSLQNGLNEEVIARLAGATRTLGCFVNFGADYLEPGVIHYGGRGTLVLGELDGALTPRLEQLHALLRRFDEHAIRSDNIWGYLWSKLAYAAMLFATAITDDAIADSLANPVHRPVHIALAREVVTVALARGIRLESFDGFDPLAFAPDSTEARTTRSLNELVAHNRRSAKTHSGIWRDLAVRHRETEVDPQLGPVVRYGRECGVPTPLTARLVDAVHRIERGQLARRSDNVIALLADGL